MDKKTYIQITLVILILVIITFVYFDYFRSSGDKSTINSENSSSENLVKGSDDLISDMSYFSVDNNGNRYEIFSEYGVLNQGSNLILMEKVNAIVYLSNDEKVLISSNKANKKKKKENH